MIVSWSGGKDSMMALREILQSQDYRVAGLVTTVMEGYERVQIQNVRRALIEQQATSLGMPIRCVYIPKNATNDEYEQKLAGALATYRDEGIEEIAFGDLFLADIRAYREAFLARSGVRGLFPLWQRDTGNLIREFIALGYKAIVTSVDAKRLDRTFAGRVLSDDFLDALPSHVDPCGERGEFHTFVYGGPLFKDEIRFRVGEVSASEGHYFCDLLPE